MADEPRHEPQDLLTEVALGIADGAERARVLEHVSGCADCRRELERQSAVADELLLLAPEQEPPPGFELGVLRAIEPAPSSRPSLLRRALPALAAATAAVAVAICVTAMAMPAEPLAPTAEPALKPNQPTHSKEAPITL